MDKIYFKWCHMNYIGRTLSHRLNVTDFWAVSVKIDEEVYYLGHRIGEEFVKNEDVITDYSYPYMVVLGLRRLEKMVNAELVKHRQQVHTREYISYNIMRKNVPDEENAQKFLKYYAKGLTFREIEKLMGKQLRSLTRWLEYFTTGKLSTDFLDPVDKWGYISRLQKAGKMKGREPILKSN